MECKCFREQLECIEIFSNNQHIKIGKICLPCILWLQYGHSLYIPMNGKAFRTCVRVEIYLNLERLNVDNLAITCKYRTLIEFCSENKMPHKLAYDVMSGAVDMRILLTKNCLSGSTKTFFKEYRQ